MKAWPHTPPCQRLPWSTQPYTHTIIHAHTTIHASTHTQPYTRARTLFQPRFTCVHGHTDIETLILTVTPVSAHTHTHTRTHTHRHTHTFPPPYTHTARHARGYAQNRREGGIQRTIDELRWWREGSEGTSSFVYKDLPFQGRATTAGSIRHLNHRPSRRLSVPTVHKQNTWISLSLCLGF
jgi:hypothetical protein